MTEELRALTNLARAASAGADDVPSLLSRVCASLASTFSLGPIAAYRLTRDAEEVTLLSGHKRVVESLDDLPAFRDAMAGGEPVCRDGALVIPLIASDSCIGFISAECAGDLERSQVELMGAAGAWIAVVLQRALEHEELERLSRLKSQFIALASHELRAPAAVIHGVAKTVAARGADLPPEQLAALHETLAGHTDRMTRLLDELLDLSRLEAKVVEIERRSLAVRDRAEEVVQTVAGHRAPEVRIEIPDELQPLLDAVAFERILGNLVTNALRYGRAPISVKAVQNDRHFRLTVEDSGDGVSPGFVPHLFERFTREGRATDTNGSGLGLSIAQAYAQAHGGQLFYEDASPRGARFQLVLPAQ